MQEILMYFWTTQKNLEKLGAKYLVCYLINLPNFLLKPHKHFSKQLLNFFLPFSFHPTENYFTLQPAVSPPSIQYVKKTRVFRCRKGKTPRVPHHTLSVQNLVFFQIPLKTQQFFFSSSLCGFGEEGRCLFLLDTLLSDRIHGKFLYFVKQHKIICCWEFLQQLS